jgi:hypothetical protein
MRLLIFSALALSLASATSSIAQANFTTNSQTAAKFGVHEIALVGIGAAANPLDTLASVAFAVA